MYDLSYTSAIYSTIFVANHIYCLNSSEASCDLRLIRYELSLSLKIRPVGRADKYFFPHFITFLFCWLCIIIYFFFFNNFFQKHEKNTPVAPFKPSRAVHRKHLFIQGCHKLLWDFI